MKNLLLLSLLCTAVLSNAQKITLLDSISKEPVSFATISFGNGKGTFADGDGVFTLSRKRYPDVDSLTVSSIGYEDLKVATANVVDELYMNPSTAQMDAIVVLAKLEGKFKEEEIDAIVHDNYFDCWLPTVESEIAVKFERQDGRRTLIKTLQIPVVLEESQASKKGKLRAFSTMFRVQFYNVNGDGSPTRQSNYPAQTFVITQETDEIHELDVEELGIQIPENGIFAAIQVLGYTYPDGRLIDAKKYREIKTRRGMEKVSTTYRPLLPFTDEIDGKQTWVRRIFFNNKTWQLFDLTYNPNSKLVRSGHDNYGMGAVLKVYEPKD
ncbi:3-ketoacyl-(acyl-carrier-protein) reductase [Nonlabens sp. YIK11]|uniref:carboxypeptidase-like regulatory domain-containing protein n=1 Tax=Nonlabens sp. YIK11 TaxID=1453349 RepID=UPI0006DCC76B|nr:carboxypeptidase-like regulatory domain-containing protein [Nonlabens sp. YIK11]KQC32559.1 3-ketoacyl-(acyl-carrier-protein) reductase [Nonlabens sp. YIK11]